MDTPEVTEAPSEDAILSAAFDNAQDETPETEVVETPVEDKPVEEPETPDEVSQEEEQEKEPETVRVEVPTDLPKDVRDVWQDMPEAARDAVLNSQRSLSAKLREQGNMMRGIEPIKDRLVEAARQFPAMQDMTARQVADQAFELAKWSNEFETKPVETILGLIQKHGIGPQVAQAMQGQPVQENNDVSSLKTTIAGLQRKIEQLSDPDYQQEQYNSFQAKTTVVDEVTSFANSKGEDWSKVESVIPAFVQAVQAQNEASGIAMEPKEVLEQAFNLATGQTPEADQEVTPPVEDVVAVDPQRAAAAKKAKSVNVKSQPSGKTRTLSEDELLSRAFDKAQAS